MLLKLTLNALSFLATGALWCAACWLFFWHAAPMWYEAMTAFFLLTGAVMLLVAGVWAFVRYADGFAWGMAVAALFNSLLNN
jgi:hypothetical protein